MWKYVKSVYIKFTVPRSSRKCLKGKNKNRNKAECVKSLYILIDFLRISLDITESCSVIPISHFLEAIKIL